MNMVTMSLGDFGISRSGMFCCYSMPVAVA